jgi:hypothetical protein
MKNSEIPPDGGFWEDYLMPFMSSRGCALLGRTVFDKLVAVRKFLIDRKFTEFVYTKFDLIKFDHVEYGPKEMAGHFVIHDCRGLGHEINANADSILRITGVYRNAPYVIFNNCEDILRQDDVLRVFVHLMDKDEYAAPFPCESFYIFLGVENTIPKKDNYSVGSADSDHFDSFCTCVRCYDFDAGKLYLG